MLIGKNYPNKKTILIQSTKTQIINNSDKSIKHTKKNFKKIAKIRKQRGYHWEDTIVKRFNGLKDWKAFRLGSPSIALPDILAVSDKKHTIITVEAKSGTNNILYVPEDQILRCQQWTNHFKLYKVRKVVLAFKFLSKRRISTGTYEHRELREFYKVWDETNPIANYLCTYDGETYAIVNGSRSKINLKEYQIPFNSKHLILLDKTI